MASPRSYPQRLPDLVYPSYMQTRRVSHNGVMYWNAWQVYIGYLLAGEEIGIEPVGDGLWQIHFGPVCLGGFDERNLKSGYYLTLKL
jgi:hypothetical protein